MLDPFRLPKIEKMSTIGKTSKMGSVTSFDRKKIGNRNTSKRRIA